MAEPESKTYSDRVAEQHLVDVPAQSDYSAAEEGVDPEWRSDRRPQGREQIEGAQANAEDGGTAIGANGGGCAHGAFRGIVPPCLGDDPGVHLDGLPPGSCSRSSRVVMPVAGALAASGVAAVQATVAALLADKSGHPATGTGRGRRCR